MLDCIPRGYIKLILELVTNLTATEVSSPSSGSVQSPLQKMHLNSECGQCDLHLEHQCKLCCPSVTVVSSQDKKPLHELQSSNNTLLYY